MAHHDEHSNSAIEKVLERLTEHGLEAMAVATAGDNKRPLYLLGSRG